MCSYSNLSPKIKVGHSCMYANAQSLWSLSFRTWIFYPHTRTYVRLLGPCFKTGQISLLFAALENPISASTSYPSVRSQMAPNWSVAEQTFTRALLSSNLSLGWPHNATKTGVLKHCSGFASKELVGATIPNPGTLPPADKQHTCSVSLTYVWKPTTESDPNKGIFNRDIRFTLNDFKHF